MNRSALAFSVLFLLGATHECRGQEADAAPTADRVEWWRDARFGMFVHWGLYSGLAGEWEGKSLGSTGGMEWAQYRAKIDTDAYAAEAIPLFQPARGFAAEWAKLAKQAGCKYLVFTTKHHDGFALHDSKVSEYDAGSVLGRDLVREIVAACRAEGLKIGFYYSVIDWHHDQFAYAESESIPHPLRGKPYPNGERNQRRYIEYLHSQVSELISDYGPVDVLWWDYSTEDFQGEEAWDAFKLIEMVKQKQPAIVMNNRLFRRPEAGYVGTSKVTTEVRMEPQYGDFMTPEQHVPEEGMPDVDWETCMTMNTTWGYSKHDDDWKSTETLLQTLIEIASKGGNFLLNVGPMADGTIPPESVESLQQIGGWLAVNGEAIYGTSASPIGRPEWGRITSKPADGLLYLHILEWPSDGKLSLDNLPADCSQAVALHGRQPVPLQRGDDRLTLDLSSIEQGPLVTVVRLHSARGSKNSQSRPPAESDMRLHADGSAWGYKHHQNASDELPRVLLIGDSILNGYRSQVELAFKGEVVVDAWVNPHYQSKEYNQALAEVLEADTYDVVHFNVGLHGWQEGRIQPGTFQPLTAAMVEVIKRKQPAAKLIWASSTPVTVKGNPEQLEPEINPVIVAHNRMAAEVMADMHVPVNDFYGLLAARLELARGDGFHWKPPAYQLLADQAVNAIRAALRQSTP